MITNSRGSVAEDPRMGPNGGKLGPIVVQFPFFRETSSKLDRQNRDEFRWSSVSLGLLCTVSYIIINMINSPCNSHDEGG